MSRFHVVPKLPATARGPGCLTCGVSHRDGGFVDLAQTVEFEGALYLCVACAREIGLGVGQVSGAGAAALVAEVDRITAIADEQRERAERAEADLGSLARAFDVLAESGLRAGLEVALVERENVDASPVTHTVDGGDSRINCPVEGCKRYFTSEGRMRQHVAAIHKEEGSE